jgi:hypothetical protein
MYKTRKAPFLIAFLRGVGTLILIKYVLKFKSYGIRLVHLSDTDVR